MESSADNTPLIVIVGPTCSGKSAAAMEVAQKYNGEIIAADSRTIYRGMDIGTAKPSAKDRARIPHHLIDIIDPGVAFTAADFKVRAQAAITDITRRGKLPIMAGGTGLYIDAVLYDFAFRTVGNPQERKRLQQLSIDELQQLLLERDIDLPANATNPRHLIRQVETGGAPATHKRLRPNTLVIGVDVPREELKARIKQRVGAMIDAGLVSEVKKLAHNYGWDCPGLQTIGYRELRAYIENKITLQAAEQEIIRATIAYAKRQRTWFARNKSIHWCSQQSKSKT